MFTSVSNPASASGQHCSISLALYSWKEKQLCPNAPIAGRFFHRQCSRELGGYEWQESLSKRKDKLATCQSLLSEYTSLLHHEVFPRSAEHPLHLSSFLLIVLETIIGELLAAVKHFTEWNNSNDLNMYQAEPYKIFPFWVD